MSAIVPPRSVTTSTTSTSTKVARRPHACRRAGRDQKEIKTIPDTAKNTYSRDAARRVKKTGEKKEGAKLAPGMMTDKMLFNVQPPLRPFAEDLVPAPGE